MIQFNWFKPTFIVCIYCTQGRHDLCFEAVEHPQKIKICTCMLVKHEEKVSATRHQA